MQKQYAKNRKALFDYEIIETLEAGISLEGAEVKSVRASNINLSGSYVIIKDNQIKLISAHISRPDHIGNNFFNEIRDRSLLVGKTQLKKLYDKVKIKGYTLTVLKIYQPEDSKKIKVELALVKGKAEYEKRETIKRREADRETKNQIKDY